MNRANSTPRATNAYERKLAQLVRIDLIIIDDYGLRPMRSPQDEDFHDLIAERYGARQYPDHQQPRLQ